MPQGIHPIHMPMQYAKFFACLLLLFASCKKQEQPLPVSVQVVSSATRAGLPEIEIFHNGILAATTDLRGEATIPAFLSTDSLTLGGADILSTVSTVSTTLGTSHQRIFEAALRATPNDSIAYTFLKQQQNTLGILPTVAHGNLVSTYDQALAAIAFLAMDDRAAAEHIFDYYESQRVQELESGLGGFHQFRSAAGVPSGNRWMGDNAWLLIALNNYEDRYGLGNYSSLSSSLNQWLAGLEDPVEGGLWGGFRANGDTIHKITEGNIDAYVAFAPSQAYDNVRASVLSHLEAEKWDSLDGNLMAWPTNPTYKYALDCYTWGYCAFPDFPSTAWTELDKFELTVTSATTGNDVFGYCFDEDQDALWYEGTGQVAVMQWFSGQASAAESTIAQMDLGLTLTAAQGCGWPYTANDGTAYGADPLWEVASTHPCISSTAWYLMATHRHNALSRTKLRSLPEAQMFWK